jgi:enoyl-CoA hydratase/carnithine racemase
MDELLTNRSYGIFQIELDRRLRKNALTSAMYLALADAKDAFAAFLAKRPPNFHRLNRGAAG